MLRRRFPIGSRGGEGSEPSVFHFSNLRAFFSEGRWRFSGVVKPAVASEQWRCTIRLTEVGEDGSVAQEIPIQRLDKMDGAVKGHVDDGAALIEAAVGSKEIHFAGASALLAHRRIGRGELSMEVVGRAGE